MNYQLIANVLNRPWLISQDWANNILPNILKSIETGLELTWEGNFTPYIVSGASFTKGKWDSFNDAPKGIGINSFAENLMTLPLW